jgi:hypothetical protein
VGVPTACNDRLDAAWVFLWKRNGSLVERYVAGASGTGNAAIKFGTGVFRFITGDIKNKDTVKLTTPTTSLTIRGTKFILAVTADGTTSVGAP